MNRYISVMWQDVNLHKQSESDSTHTKVKTKANCKATFRKLWTYNII